MGYDIEGRSKEQNDISLEKWNCRKDGRLYKAHQVEKEMKMENLCKYQPRSMIKKINMQTALC